MKLRKQPERKAKIKRRSVGARSLRIKRPSKLKKQIRRSLASSSCSSCSTGQLSRHCKSFPENMACAENSLLLLAHTADSESTEGTTSSDKEMHIWKEEETAFLLKKLSEKLTNYDKNKKSIHTDIASELTKVYRPKKAFDHRMVRSRLSVAYNQWVNTQMGHPVSHAFWTSLCGEYSETIRAAKASTEASSSSSVQVSRKRKHWTNSTILKHLADKTHAGDFLRYKAALEAHPAAASAFQYFSDFPSQKNFLEGLASLSDKGKESTDV